MTSESNENFDCPYCGQTNLLVIDITGGPNQQFIVDCEVCCSPIIIRLKIRGKDVVSIDIKKENE